MSKSVVYKFVAPLDEVESMMVSTVVYIPDAVMKKLPQSRVRVKGKINGAAFALAIQYRRSGRSFLIISKPLRKAAGISARQKVTVEFSIVSDKVEIPAEMKEVINLDPEGAKAWKTLTPGLQRSLCHYVNGVKNIDSRIKRALYLMEKVKQGAYVKRPDNRKSSLKND